MADQLKSTTLETFDPVAGVIIQQALDKQRAEIYTTMTDKLEDVKTSLGDKVDDLATEMRNGFELIQRELGTAKTERTVQASELSNMRRELGEVKGTVKANHKNVSWIRDLLDKIFDPKRGTILVAAITGGYGIIRSRAKHLLPWFADHPNTEYVLQSLAVVACVAAVVYVFRRLPLEERCEPQEKSGTEQESE